MIRVTTCRPITPRYFWIFPAINRVIKVIVKTASKEAIIMIIPDMSPSSFAVSNMAAPIAPGPAIKGVANGNIEMSFFNSASLDSSLVVVTAPDDRANTMSIPMSNSNMPPAALIAGSDIPRTSKSISPVNTKTTNMMVAVSVPRIAITRLC